MKLTSSLLKTISLILAILSIVAFAAGVYVLVTSPVIHNNSGMLFALLIWMASLVFAAIYGFKGFGKPAAKFYKAFLILVLISLLVYLWLGVNCLLNGEARPDLATVILTALCCICVAIFAFVKDFGKLASTVFAYIYLIAGLAIFFIGLLTAEIPAIIVSFGQFLLAEITFVLVDAKYIDKDARGTK